MFQSQKIIIKEKKIDKMTWFNFQENLESSGMIYSGKMVRNGCWEEGKYTWL